MTNQREWLYTGGEGFVLYNPASPSQEAASRAGSTTLDIAHAVEASALAQKDWRHSTVATRSAVLRKAGDILLRDEMALADVITRETGKHIRDSLAELRNAAGVLHYYAGRAWNSLGEVLPSVRTGVSLKAFRNPIGVVALISPWNFPVNLLAIKIAPALAMGNTVVAKPSTIGAGASLMLIDALYEAGLPDGAVSVVLGDGGVVGEALVRADGISAVSFTGSTSVGRRVAVSATQLGRRYLCEMGGKNASVVMADADLDLAIDALIPAAFSASGQKCTATSRIIVEHTIAQEFSDRFSERAASIRFGDPLEEASYSGPVVNAAQYESIVSVVEQARGAGKQLLTEWKLPSSPGTEGYFIPATVVGHVAPDDRLFQQEVFGPVVTISETDSVQSAIEMVNHSEYGLSASIFTNDLDAAAAFERDVECGVVNVNLPTTGVEFQTPYAGWKGSGTSYQEQGDDGFTFYTKGKSVAVRTSF